MTDQERQFRKIRRFFSEQIPFNRYLGMELAELRPGFARLNVPFRQELVGDPMRPALHGGVLSATMDAAGGAAAFTLVDVGDRISTIDLRVDYLRPAELRDIAAEARVTRMGNRVASIDIISFHSDDRERLIATGKAVYNVKRADER